MQASSAPRNVGTMLLARIRVRILLTHRVDVFLGPSEGCFVQRSFAFNGHAPAEIDYPLAGWPTS